MRDEKATENSRTVQEFVLLHSKVLAFISRELMRVQSNTNNFIKATETQHNALYLYCYGVCVSKNALTDFLCYPFLRDFEVAATLLISQIVSF